MDLLRCAARDHTVSLLTLQFVHQATTSASFGNILSKMHILLTFRQVDYMKLPKPRATTSGLPPGGWLQSGYKLLPLHVSKKDKLNTEYTSYELIPKMVSVSFFTNVCSNVHFSNNFYPK